MLQKANIFCIALEKIAHNYTFNWKIKGLRKANGTHKFSLTTTVSLHKIYCSLLITSFKESCIHLRFTINLAAFNEVLIKTRTTSL